MRYITADTIFDGEKFLPPGTILKYDRNRLSGIFAGEVPLDDRTERYDGVLLPGFINAHCHLELSHLQGKVPERTGLSAFGPQIVKKRGAFSEEEAEEKMLEADQAMFEKGVAAVGDISNTSQSFSIKRKSRIHYHTFIELIGFHPRDAAQVLEKGKVLLEKLREAGLEGSLAAHSPYSCSLQLIGDIVKANAGRKLPFSIHNQESEEENKFFLQKDSGFYGLYEELGIDISWWQPPGKNSLSYYYSDMSGNCPSILVHNTFTGAADVAATRGRGIYWCFCPSANLYIEDNLPDFNLFVDEADYICIGTDSLASNSALDPVKELNHLYKRSIFSPEQLLAMLTSNGARALGLEGRFGRLTPGAAAGLNLIEIKSQEIIFKKRII